MLQLQPGAGALTTGRSAVQAGSLEDDLDAYDARWSRERVVLPMKSSGRSLMSQHGDMA